MNKDIDRKGGYNMLDKKVLLQITLILCLVTFVSDVFAEPISKKLSKNEELYPQGWSVGDQVKFKKNTVVMINDSGAVISGTLANDTFLRSQGWQRIINDYYFISAYTNGGNFFPRHYRYWNNSNLYSIALPSYGHVRYKGGTAVSFSAEGTVTSGTVANDITIGIGDNQYGFVTLKSDSIVGFYDDGAVKMGTLAENTKLRPIGWQNNAVDLDNAGFVEFKAKTEINFSIDGYVLKGSPKKALIWKNNGIDSTFRADEAVEFTEQGAASAAE